MKKLIAFAFLLFPFTAAFAVNCVTIVLNAPGCDLQTFQCQLVILPNSNTFQVRVVNVPWTEEGMQRLRRPRNIKAQYYMSRITQFQDGADRSINFVATFSAVSFAVSDEGLVVTEIELTPPEANDNLFGFNGSQDLRLELPAMSNLAALGQNRFFLYNGANLIGRVNAITGIDGGNGVDFGSC